MLTPETLNALDQALSAVIDEAGHDPQYEQLSHALSAAQDALPSGKADERPEDAHGFAAAREQHVAAAQGAHA